MDTVWTCFVSVCVCVRESTSRVMPRRTMMYIRLLSHVQCNRIRILLFDSINRRPQYFPEENQICTSQRECVCHVHGVADDKLPKRIGKTQSNPTVMVGCWANDQQHATEQKRRKMRSNFKRKRKKKKLFISRIYLIAWIFEWISFVRVSVSFSIHSFGDVFGCECECMVVLRRKRRPTWVSKTTQ